MEKNSYCADPMCNFEATSVCKKDSRLSICEIHRNQHEKLILDDFENQLSQLKEPMTDLKNRIKANLEEFERSRDEEFSRIKSIFDKNFSLIDRRLNILKTNKEQFEKAREYAKMCRQTGQQPKSEDFSKFKELLKKVQEDLQKQIQISQMIDDRNVRIESWNFYEEEEEAEKNNSKSVDLIELSDSESETSLETSIDPELQADIGDETTALENKEQIFGGTSSEETDKTNKNLVLSLFRTVCPLTKLGVFGLMESHNLTKFCTENSKQTTLLTHLIFTHRIKPQFSHEIVKAMSQNQDPITTIIFPQDHRSILIESIRCPFDGETLKKISQPKSIVKTPCQSSLDSHHVEHHFIETHGFSRNDAKTIYDEIKRNGQIHQLSCLQQN